MTKVFPLQKVLMYCNACGLTVQCINDNSSNATPTVTNFMNTVFLPVGAHKFNLACLVRLLTLCYLHCMAISYHTILIIHPASPRQKQNSAQLLLFANPTQTDLKVKGCAGNIPRTTKTPAYVYCHFQ